MTTASLPRVSLRELGIRLGQLQSGPNNAITDIAGVKVGQVTLVSGEGELRPGIGPVRTGITVIFPHEGDLYLEKVRAAVHTINGYGKVAGFEQVRELGTIEAPDAPLTSLQLKRLCHRAVIGLARTGSVLKHGSGDFVIAFSTADRVPHRSARLIGSRDILLDEAPVMNGFFQAVAETVEEAVLNSLTCAETMRGRDDHLAEALPLEPLLELLSHGDL